MTIGKSNALFPEDRINYIPNHGWVTYSLFNECRKFLYSKDLDYYSFFQRLEEVWKFLPIIVAGDPRETAIKTINLIRDGVFTAPNYSLNQNQRIDLYNELNKGIIEMRLRHETKNC